MILRFREGDRFAGSPRDIVAEMRRRSFYDGLPGGPLASYVRWAIANVGRMHDVALASPSADVGEDALCRTFLDAVVAAGLASWENGN